MLFQKYLDSRPDCQKGETILLHGRMTKTEKSKTVNSIKTAPAFIALMTFDLGGTGHNFQEADQIIFLDRHWNPQVYIHTNKAKYT
jgi:SNF2 family DNA or RNA helicase